MEPEEVVPFWYTGREPVRHNGGIELAGSMWLVIGAIIGAALVWSWKQR